MLKCRLYRFLKIRNVFDLGFVIDGACIEEPDKWNDDYGGVGVSDTIMLFPVARASSRCTSDQAQRFKLAHAKLVLSMPLPPDSGRVKSPQLTQLCSADKLVGELPWLAKTKLGKRVILWWSIWAKLVNEDGFGRLNLMERAEAPRLRMLTSRVEKVCLAA